MGRSSDRRYVTDYLPAGRVNVCMGGVAAMTSLILSYFSLMLAVAMAFTSGSEAHPYVSAAWLVTIGLWLVVFLIERGH